MARQYEDTDTRRRQVAQAALAVIAEDGVSGFTTRSVAQHVGINDSTLFRHFGSKEEIVVEAMALLTAEIDRGLHETGDFMEDLEAFFRHRAAFVGAQASVGRLIFSEEFVHLAGDRALECIQGWRGKSLKYLASRLEALQKDGRLRADLDVASMSMLVQGALLSLAFQASAAKTEPTADLEARIDKAWSAIQIIFSP